ncbi:hypothetical protein KAI04_00635 [Candidatus Pacearchaeota archaeon]|nr:hypothetical protein [Candidatus Pacearchaeota archaeon]
MKYVYEFTNQRKLTKSEFLKYFQKKVLYTIRKFEMIKNNDLIFYENKGDFRGVVLEDVLKMFSEKADIKLVKRNNFKAKKAISSTIDMGSDKFIHELIKGKVENLRDLKAVQGKVIKPLYLFLDEEVLLYAKLKGLKFRKEDEKKDNISNFIGNLEEKHPEIKRAIINSYLELF